MYCVYKVTNKINNHTYIGQASHNKGKVYYKNPNGTECGLYFIGTQPDGWVRGRYTPWQGQNK